MAYKKWRQSKSIKNQDQDKFLNAIKKVNYTDIIHKF